MNRRIAILFGLALAVSSCEFGEVQIPEGEPMLVIFAVMRPDLNRQWVLVEQTLTGTTAAADTISGVIPGDALPVPVAGAAVSVTNLSLSGDSCSSTHFTEAAAPRFELQSPGVYWGAPLGGCPTMSPGDTLELRVETVEGSVVTGRTEVVGAESMTLRLGSDSYSIPGLYPGEPIEFNRDTDTLDAEVIAIAGRAIQIEVGRQDSVDVPDPSFIMFLDSTLISVPGNIVNLLDAVFGEEDSTSNDSPASIFTAGRYHTVTVALMDDNFFDYQRTANAPLSGRGFVNHLEGGMGVFGNLVASRKPLKVVGNLDDDREGGYRMVGAVDGVAVDVSLELYVAAAGKDTTDMAAFVQGDWVLGNLDTSADGFFRGSEMALTIFQESALGPYQVSALLLDGAFDSGGGFTLTAFDRQLTEVGTLTVTRN